jgi:hypothetical protein
MNDSCFFIGDTAKFLNVLNLFKGDAEFRLRLNYDDGSIDLEAILMSGIIAIAAHIVPEEADGILVYSPLLRSRPIPLVVCLETQTITKTLTLLCKRPSAYMSIHGDTEKIVIRAYDHDDSCTAESTINTIVRNDEEDVEFKIFSTELEHAVTHTMVGNRWKDFLPDGEVNIRHESIAKRFVFRLVDVLCTTELYLPSTLPLGDVNVTMLPEVVKLFKQVVTVCPREEVTVCLDSNLPVFINVPLGSGGLRVYLGTKEDDE